MEKRRKHFLPKYFPLMVKCYAIYVTSTFYHLYPCLSTKIQKMQKSKENPRKHSNKVIESAGWVARQTACCKRKTPHPIWKSIRMRRKQRNHCFLIFVTMFMLAERVHLCNRICGCVENNSVALTPSIVLIFYHNSACDVK